MYSYVPLRAFVWTLLGLDGYLNSIVPTFTMVGEWFLGAIIIVYLLFPLQYRLVSKPLSHTKAAVPEHPFHKGKTGAMLLLLGAGTLYVFFAHPIPALEIKADPVVDMFFFLSGGVISGFFGGTLSGRHRLPTLLISGTLLFLWIFVRLPFGSLISTEGIALLLTESMAAILIFMFLIALSSYLERSAILVRLIMRAAPYTYGVFLIHHIVESQICAHFDIAMLGKGDVVFLLILCLIAVAVFTLMLYSIRDAVKRLFSA